MIRQMNENETRYVQINNKNNQINLSSIISRFSKVRRFLTPAEMRVCLKKGASLYSVDGDKLTLLTASNYNMIEDESVKEEVEVKEPVTSTKTPVVEEVKKSEATTTSSPVKEVSKSEEDEIVPDTDDETVPENVEEEVIEIK